MVTNPFLMRWVVEFQVHVWFEDVWASPLGGDGRGVCMAGTIEVAKDYSRDLTPVPSPSGEGFLILTK